MNDPIYLKKLLHFIRDLKWDNLDSAVQVQAKKMFLDLSGAICAGAKNNSAQKAAAYVAQNFSDGEIHMLATGKTTNLIGAALANGMAANALDLDDGYSLLRGHPGSGFFGALLSAGELANCTYEEFLTALVVCYEISIRQGYAIRHYYGWDHSSGCYSAFATAAGIGKLLKLDEYELEMALGIADFMAPLTPAKRSCYVPSMNKDGIYYGQHTGAQAVMLAKSGITGKNPVILDDEYISYIDSLGEKYYFFDLYIKFHSCCRWAHSPIRAVADLMATNDIKSDDIEKVDVYSFGNAGTLYKQAPQNEDEAQYNIKYPIAAQILFGKCSPIESSTERMLDERVPAMIEKIRFHHEPEYDKVFPAKRLSRVEITLSSGATYVSRPYEPLGDINADVSIDDIKIKVHDINGAYADPQTIDDMIDAILQTDGNEPFRKPLNAIHKLAYSNNWTETKHI